MLIPDEGHPDNRALKRAFVMEVTEDEARWLKELRVKMKDKWWDTHEGCQSKIAEIAKKQEERKDMPYDAMVDNTCRHSGAKLDEDVVEVVAYQDDEGGIDFYDAKQPFSLPAGWKRVRVRFI